MEDIVYFLGTSFIDSYFDSAISSIGRGKKYQDKALPVLLAEHLHLADRIGGVHFHGESGGKVRNFLVPQDVFDVNPTIVVLDLATNDLAERSLHPFEILSTCSAVISLGEILVTIPSVTEVIVCSCIYRTHKIASQKKADFSKNVDFFNKCLRELCDSEQKISYHTHRGFWRKKDRSPLPVKHWSKDGIHPNSKKGRISYGASLTQAVHLALKVR
jgi:hypothetical protein